MKNIISQILIMGSLVALTACGGGGGGGTTPPATADPATAINIYAESSQTSGTAVDASGVWESRCHYGPGNDRKRKITFDGLTYSYAETHYTSGDLSCSGTATTYDSDFQLPISTNGTKMMNTWIDGATLETTAPTRTDNAGLLTTSPIATRLDVDVTGGTFLSAVTAKQIYYIDDTTTPWVLHRDHFQSKDTDGYANNLADHDMYYKIGATSSYSLLTATTGAINLQSGDIQGSINTACYVDGSSNGIIENISISDTTWTYTVKTYASDAACTNTPTTTTAVATLTVGSNRRVSRWINGSGVTVTPPATALDSGKLLPSDAPYTVIHGVVTSSNNPDINVAQTFSSGYVIDKSSTGGVVLYRVQDTTKNIVTIADPFTNIPAPASGPNLVININSVVNTNYSTTEIAYTIQNTGDTATNTGFQVMGWQDRAGAPVYGVASSGNFNNHNILAAGASESAVLTVSNVTVVPGASLNAYLIVDMLEAIGESDEGLTGANDNLSSLPWTAGDLFEYRGSMFSDRNTTTTITATYYTGSDYTRLRFNDSANGGYTFIIDLNGEIANQTYTLTDFTSPGTVRDVSDISPTETYTLMPWEPVTPQSAQITFSSVDVVTGRIAGGYAVNLCLSSASQTCSTTKVYTGSFSMIRDADAP